MNIREVTKPKSSLELYLRAALPLVPGASHVPLLPVPKGRELPDLELVMRDVAVDRARLDTYNDVCGFAGGDVLPATYPHILAFPLHMALMTDGSFPFAPVGLVHIENAITVRRPIAHTEALSLRVFATGLEPHPKGKRFSIVTEARILDELVWEERSTMLRRGSGGGDSPGRPAGASSNATGGTVGQEWDVPSDIGRRYAGVSGDRNPIHLYDLTAKLFGFPRAIAHGMWSKARCLAALEGDLPGAYTVEVEFRRPIFLPAKVRFASTQEEGDVRFGVVDAKAGKPHLDGMITTA
jgi:acyl dehydratase